MLDFNYHIHILCNWTVIYKFWKQNVLFQDSWKRPWMNISTQLSVFRCFLLKLNNLQRNCIYWITLTVLIIYNTIIIYSLVLFCLSVKCSCGIRIWAKLSSSIYVVYLWSYTRGNIISFGLNVRSGVSTFRTKKKM